MKQISDDDLKEIFAIFTSSTKHELNQIYDEGNQHFFGNEKLNEEYELTEEKKEYSLDAIRAVIYWLKRNGYSLEKNGQKDNLSWIDEYFI